MRIRPTLTVHHLVETRCRWAIEERPHALAGFRVHRAVMHRLECGLRLKFSHSRVVSSLQRLEKFPADKALEVGKLLVGPSEPFFERGLLAFLDRGKSNENHKHESP